MANSKAKAKAAFKNSMQAARDYDKAATAARTGGYERAQSALDAGFAQLNQRGSKSATRSAAHTLAVMAQRQAEAKKQQIRTGNSLGDLLGRYGGVYAKAGGIAFDPAKVQAQTGVNISAVGSRIANLNLQTAGGISGIMKQGAISAKASADQALANALDQRSTEEELKVLEMKQEAALQKQASLDVARSQAEAASSAASITEAVRAAAVGGSTRAGAQAIMDSLLAVADLSSAEEAQVQTSFDGLYPEQDPESQSPAYSRLDPETGLPMTTTDDGTKPLAEEDKAIVATAVAGWVAGTTTDPATGATLTGAPLSFFEMQEKLRVVAVTNNYDVAETTKYAAEIYAKLTGKTPDELSDATGALVGQTYDMQWWQTMNPAVIPREILRDGIAYIMSKPDSWDAFKSQHPELNSWEIDGLIRVLEPIFGAVA